MSGLAAIASPAPFSTSGPVVLDDAVSDLAWSDGGAALLVGCADGMLHRLQADGTPSAAWQAHAAGITRVCPRPGDRGGLGTAGEDGRVILWDGTSGGSHRTLSEESDWVEHLAWAPDGQVLAAAARKTISLWQDAESLGIWYDARRQVLAMAWAPDGRRLATAANKGLYLWRMTGSQARDAQPVQLLAFPGAPVAVAWQRTGKALAVGTQDGFLQIWRPADRQGAAKQLTMRGYPGKVSCLAWHPRTAVIATAGGPDVVLWELPQGASGSRGRPLRHHQATITALAWSADGRLLASGDRSGRVCLWDSHGEALYARTLGHEISAMQWQPGGGVLAVGDTEGGLHLVGPAKDTKDE